MSIVLGRRSLRPGQLGQPVEVGAHHRVLAEASGMRSRRFSSLRACVSTSSGMPAACRWPRAARRSRLRPAAAFAELLLDLAFSCSRRMYSRWRLVERFLGLLADLLRQAQHLDALPASFAQHLVQTRSDTSNGLQDLLLLRGADVDDVGDKVRQHGRRLELVHCAGKLLGRIWQQRHRLPGPLAQLMDTGGEFGRQGFRVCRSPQCVRQGTGSRPGVHKP